MTRPSTHGGRRAGAGRKPSTVVTARVAVCLPEPIAAELRQHAPSPGLGLLALARWWAELPASERAQPWVTATDDAAT